MPSETILRHSRKELKNKVTPSRLCQQLAMYTQKVTEAVLLFGASHDLRSHVAVALWDQKLSLRVCRLKQKC